MSTPTQPTSTPDGEPIPTHTPWGHRRPAMETARERNQRQANEFLKVIRTYNAHKHAAVDAQAKLDARKLADRLAEEAAAVSDANVDKHARVVWAMLVVLVLVAIGFGIGFALSHNPPQGPISTNVVPSPAPQSAPVQP